MNLCRAGGNDDKNDRMMRAEKPGCQQDYRHVGTETERAANVETKKMCREHG